MSAQDTGFNLELSRRKLLAAAGIGGGAVDGGVSDRNRSRSGRTRRTPIARSGGDAAGRRTASAVRRGCIVGDGGVLAHAAAGSQSACRARASRRQARADGRGQADQLHRCQVRPGRLRLSCEARPAAGRLRLSVRRDARRRRAGVRHVPHRAARPRAVHLHQLRRSGHADPRQEVRAARGRDAAEPAVRERQSRLAGGRRHHARRRAAAAAVPPVQRRSLLRQSRRGPGADLVGFLGEQQPQRAQASLDALGRQPRERAGQRTDRLSGLSDLLLGAGGGRPDRCDARALVRLHRRLGAGDQHRQRRRRLPGRRQLLRPRLFGGRAEGLAGKGTGRRPRQSRHRLDRGVHAPGRHLDGRQVQRRRPRHPRGMGAAVRQIRRRPRGVRARAPLRALAPDPRPGSERHPDADPRGDRHRRDRHHQGNGAHGDRRRRNVRRRRTSCSSTRRSAG